jgi:5-methyltetrahydropteroyltriglutamate--homocysteine methyltransferase
MRGERRVSPTTGSGGGDGLPLLPTSIVGSLPQPEWLIDREQLGQRFPPRVRARDLWRPAPEYLQQAQDDATLLGIDAQHRAGLDILTDGEMRRESYSNHFATALEGVDIDNPGEALDRSGHPNPVPRVTGPVRRPVPVEAADVEFLRRHTDRVIKATVPGPFTMSQQAQDDYSPTPTPSTPRSTTSLLPAPTSCRSTSRTCRPGRSRPGSTASRR